MQEIVDEQAAGFEDGGLPGPVGPLNLETVVAWEKPRLKRTVSIS
jgi:hypothetical protein